MGDGTWTAWVGAAASLLGAGVAWLAARNVEGRKGEIAVAVGKKLEATKAELAKDLAANESALRVTAERQLGVFKLAAESAEAAMRCLWDWERALDDAMQSALRASAADGAAAGKPAEANQAKETAALKLAALDAHIHTALRVGLFLPPKLDEPYDAACSALKKAAGTIARAEFFRDASRDDKEGYREVLALTFAERKQDVQTARESVSAFASSFREWKSGEWPKAATAKGSNNDGK